MAPLSRRIFCTAAASLAASGMARAESAVVPKPAAPGMIAGALLPLSGTQSLTGDECLRGIQLAADAVNATGGIAGVPLSMAAGDAFGQGQAEGVTQSLINTGHAGLILGSGVSALSFPGSAAAELAQIPFIELCAPADGITNRGFHFLLRTGPTSTMIAATALTTIIKRFPGKKLGLLFNTGATAGAIAGAIAAALQQARTPPILAIGYAEDSADLHDPAGRMKRAGVEVLLHAAGPSDVLNLFLAMQNLGWKPQAVIGAGDGYALRETAYALGPAFDDTFIIAAPFYPPRAAYIADAYQQRFGMPPRSADSLTCFVGAKLVFDMLNQAGGDATRLLAAMRKTDIPGGELANGWGVSFDKNGQNTRSFTTLQQWRDATLTALS